jgi:hypothetical protein
VYLIGYGFRKKLRDSFSLGIHSHLLPLPGQREQLPCQAFQSPIPPPPLSICCGLLLLCLECKSKGIG